jgi:hypothetical protein
LFQRPRSGLKRNVTQFHFNQAERSDISGALAQLVSEAEKQLGVTRAIHRDHFG